MNDVSEYGPECAFERVEKARITFLADGISSDAMRKFYSATMELFPGKSTSRPKLVGLLFLNRRHDQLKKQTHLSLLCEWTNLETDALFLDEYSVLYQ